jgi:hypothetical protein
VKRNAERHRLVQLARAGKFPKKDLAKAQKELGIDPNKIDPCYA